MGTWYATREDVMRAVDSKETARNAAQIDRALEAASRGIEALCHRTFYPEIATRYFDWPNPQRAVPWRLWLDQNELISVTTLSSAGATIPSTDYLLEPNAYGPPYNQIQINLGSSSAFGGGSTHQRNIAVTGLYGYRDDEYPAASLDGDVTSGTTSIDVTAAPLIGVGSLLRVAGERMTVTGRSMRSTFVTTTAAMAPKASDDLIAGVSVGFSVGETILIEGERMLIVDQSPAGLVVKRGWDGSTLAAHTLGATIYAPRTLTVARGVLGTAAASHSTTSTVYEWTPPGPIRQLAVAEALTFLGLEQSGYARTQRIGDGAEDKARDQRGIQGLRDQVYASHGRKARIRGV
ncbi:hypothetical protein ACFWJT_15910 [Streptomyces sp. NPDC127069]|uniref:hypothetical protein n=1 Tax=Streptomyces sp. NPDC127069 TaxID=3347128 RepID=UPI00366739E1